MECIKELGFTWVEGSSCEDGYEVDKKYIRTTKIMI